MSRKFLIAAVITSLCAACAAPLKMTPKNPAPAKSAAAKPAKAAKPAQDETALATTTLARISTYTNMSDAQYGRVQQATESLQAKQPRRALDLLGPLERELRSETKTYLVKAGDSLWSIAAQADVYANALLWPLLAQANAAVLSKTGYQVHAGQKLLVKLHPTVDESIKAIRDSERGELTVTVGGR